MLATLPYHRTVHASSRTNPKIGTFAKIQVAMRFVHEKSTIGEGDNIGGPATWPVKSRGPADDWEDLGRHLK